MPNEEVQKAIQILQEHAIRRGDSFDIGSEDKDYEESSLSSPKIIEILNNPQMLAESLNLTAYQAENLRSLITAGGAGVSHKFLARHIGDELAGAIGGFLGGYISKRIIGR